jgi:hypothetical protein
MAEVQQRKVAAEVETAAAAPTPNNTVFARLRVLGDFVTGFALVRGINTAK